MDEIRPFLRYVLDCGDAIIEKGANRLQVLECIKDAYGSPYLPGSTVKGMFRTILLGADIVNRPEEYQRGKEQMWRNADNNAGRTQYLKRNMGEIENTRYRTLAREGTRWTDAVNDIMQGMIFSDSEPLSTDVLVLCQKVDVHVNGEERRLPILRECIKPGAEIRFTLTVDTGICRLTEETLKEAVRIFMENYCKNFAGAFTGIEKPRPNYVLCGGGCGFASKTIVYPMYGKKDGTAMTQKIFEKTRVPREHKHNRDGEYGVSPHTIKCTRYQGKMLQMGLCEVESIKVI